jgi:hypothetical protein
MPWEKKTHKTYLPLFLKGSQPRLTWSPALIAPTLVHSVLVTPSGSSPNSGREQEKLGADTGQKLLLNWLVLSHFALFLCVFQIPSWLLKLLER